MVAPEFFAVAVNPYDPLLVEEGEVTVTVAVPEPPGERVSDVGDTGPVQPEGTASVSANEEAVQDALSALVTDSVNATAVPAATPALCDGDRLTVGFARVHGAATTYVAEAVAVYDVAPEFFAVAVNP